VRLRERLSDLANSLQVVGFKVEGDTIAGIAVAGFSWLIQRMAENSLTAQLVTVLIAFPTTVAGLILFRKLRPQAEMDRLAKVVSAQSDADAESRGFISFREATTTAYEQLRQAGSIYAIASDKLGYTGNGETRVEAVLSWFAYCIAPKIPVYGKHPPSRLRELIDPKEFSRGGFVDGGNALRYHNESELRYIELEVRRADLERAIEQLKNAEIEQSQEHDDADAEFEAGYNKAMFKSNTSNRDAVVLRLAQLRTEGVVIRNKAAGVEDGNVEEWIRNANAWMLEVIKTIGQISAADSEYFRTLDIVPPARVQVPMKLKNAAYAPLFIFRYNAHDLRLVRLDELFRKYTRA
jgi:hypothetical protein